MEVGQRVDHHLGELAVGRRVASAAVLRRHDVAHHDAVAALHHQERDPDDRFIVAVEVGARRQREALPEARERAVLAVHVVGRRRDRSERGAPQDVLDRLVPLAEAQQVSEVRVAPAELAHLERALGALELSAQVAGELRLVEAFVLANVDELGRRRGIAHGARSYHTP